MWVEIAYSTPVTEHVTKPLSDHGDSVKGEAYFRKK